MHFLFHVAIFLFSFPPFKWQGSSTQRIQINHSKEALVLLLTSKAKGFDITYPSISYMA